MRALAAAVALLAATDARAGSLSALGVGDFNPHLPVFGPGKFVNVFDSDDALANASAHVGWALAIPLAGQYVGGRKGLWVAGISWMALSLTQEAFFHAPPRPGRGYPAEVRADLLTRLVPTALVLAWDALRGGRAPASAPSVTPRPLRAEASAPGERSAAPPRPLWMCLDASH